ncbi:MAG: hypothetical protein K1X79_13215 [Oligoflexia bacterium]|nr:hypothetical protein [Oligoflexia bacterium]
MLRYVYLCLLVFGLSRWGMPIHDPDLGWQLLGGDWILKHGTLPPYDIINSLNTTWHDYHWLAQILLSSIYATGGFFLLKLCFGLFMGAFAVLILTIILRCSGRNHSTLAAAALGFVAYSFIASISSVRPQMLALFILGLCVLLLESKHCSYRVPAILGLGLLLANFHVYWIFIPILWFIYELLPGLMHRPIRIRTSSLATQALLISLGLCTPYGTSSYALIWDYLNLAPTLRATIAEFQSPFSASARLSALLVVFAALLVGTFNKRRWLAKSQHVSLATLGLVLGCLSIKYLGIAGIFSLPYLSRALRSLSKTRAPDLLRAENTYLSVAVFPLLIIGLCLAIAQFPTRQDALETEYLEHRFGLGICQKLARLPLRPGASRTHVRLLTNFNQGGWCRWAVQQVNPALDLRVTLDGRTQYVPDQRFQDAISLFGGKAGWEGILNDLAPDAVLTAINQPLAGNLAKSPRWHEVLRDKDFVVFVPSHAL